MLNIKMPAKQTMPHAHGKTEIGDQFADFTARTIEIAVTAIGQGLDVRTDVLANVSFAMATQRIKSAIAAGLGKDGVKAKEIKDMIVVGLVLQGRAVFKGQPVPTVATATEAGEYIRYNLASGFRFLNSITSFLSAASKVATLATGSNYRSQFVQCMGKRTEREAHAAYLALVAPIVAQVMSEAKKVADEAKKKKPAVALVLAYLNKQEDLTASDVAAIILALNDKHAELTAIQQAADARVLDMVDEEVELDEAA
jgi:hypothetical protein